MCYILLKFISKLFDFDQKLYRCYQFITDYDNIVLSYIWSYLTMSNLTKSNLWHLTFWERTFYLEALMLKYILMQWILKLRSKKEIKHPCRIPQKHWFFLLHHLYEGLKNEYLTVKDPFTLWSNLKEIYDYQKTMSLPKARYHWMHLRLQDFKTFSEYNSAFFKINFELKLCGKKSQKKTC